MTQITIHPSTYSGVNDDTSSSAAGTQTGTVTANDLEAGMKLGPWFNGKHNIGKEGGPSKNHVVYKLGTLSEKW